ncbi:Hypothetical protein D9617_38g091120 [Elsinoe fawcettii]|nr:Hypothetical protein D9617_38g091120 [Elsinoe fawcettii]
MNNMTPLQDGRRVSSDTPRSGALALRQPPSTLVLDLQKHDGPTVSDDSLDIVVRIKVQDEEYKISAKVLREYSAYFANSLSDVWKTPDKSPKITMHKHEKGTFELFADWVVNGTIFVSCERTLAGLSYSLLFKAFVLGHNILATKFRNEIMDIITMKFEAGHPPEQILPKIAYDGTPPKSPLRRILVDIYAYRGSPDFVTSGQNQVYIYKEFLTDLVCALYNLRHEEHANYPYPFSMEHVGCKYHDHGLTGNKDCKGPNVNLRRLQLGEEEGSGGVELPSAAGSADGMPPTPEFDGRPQEPFAASTGFRGSALIQELPDDYVTRPGDVEHDAQESDGLFMTPVMTRRFEKNHDSGYGGTRFISTIPADQMDTTDDRNTSGSPCPAPRQSSASALAAPVGTPAEHLPPPAIKRERDVEAGDTPTTNTTGKKIKKRKMTPAEKKRMEERAQELQSIPATINEPFALD